MGPLLPMFTPRARRDSELAGGSPTSHTKPSCRKSSTLHNGRRRWASHAATGRNLVTVAVSRNSASAASQADAWPLAAMAGEHMSGIVGASQETAPEARTKPVDVVTAEPRSVANAVPRLTATTVLAGAFAVGRISGGAFTPAVSRGAAVGGLFGWSTPWVHIVVQVVAGAAAGLTVLALNPDDKRSGRGTPLRPHQPHSTALRPIDQRRHIKSLQRTVPVGVRAGTRAGLLVPEAVSDRAQERSR
ncbi:Major intrinsic protein [Saccharopolyspora shandongensis]|uniref:Major intrinsic protein n=1 Tax=Saccharopolyspora shandongensis TaxID=418495 RepID=A0A1H3B8W2_9PSEU|nr:Major intrinsic protein [Saccharopolyspora shandongensis]